MKTSSKSLRIPNDMIADIENEATEKNTTFSDIAIERMRHKGENNTPYILTEVQTIINLCRNGEIEKAQEEENKLWKKVLI